MLFVSLLIHSFPCCFPPNTPQPVTTLPIPAD
jgi:hypothetical protein